MLLVQVNYVLQEAVIVIKDIFRRYPNRYESIIGTLCENLDTLDEPEAKVKNAASITILHSSPRLRLLTSCVAWLGTLVFAVLRRASCQCECPSLSAWW